MNGILGTLIQIAIGGLVTYVIGFVFLGLFPTPSFTSLVRFAALVKF
jgi:hypothetical protein